MSKKRYQKMPSINLHAAGIDIGSEEHWVAIGQGKECVRKFGSFTSDLHEMAKWLQDNEIRSIAMESTGTYWIPVYEVLEFYGFEVYLVNASHVKNVPGRKTDMLDCQWLQLLHTYGLLRASFIPPDQIRSLRSYMRLREEHISSGARHIQRMQKALDQMNIKLHEVISDIVGVSGMRILRSIVDGERDPETLAQMCDPSILKRKKDRVILSLQGNYRQEHIFALKQELEAYDFFQQRVKACDRQIKNLLEEMTSDLPPVEETSSPKKIRRRKPDFDLHQYVLQLTGGIDLGALPGFTDLTVLQLLSETGLDMSLWPTEKHFTSWLVLAPLNKKSGGKIKGKFKRKAKSRATQIFRLAARNIGRSNSALGAFYRRIRSRKGPGIANVATARKLAVLFYHLLRYGKQYVEPGIQAYEQKFRERQIKSLKMKAKALGLQLVEA